VGVKVAQKVDYMLFNHPECVGALVSRRELKVGHVPKADTKRNPIVLQWSVSIVDGDILLNVSLLHWHHKRNGEGRGGRRC